MLDVQRQTGALVAAGSAGTSQFWWPNLIGRAAQPTSAEQAQLAAIVSHRASLPERPDLKSISFTPAAGHTWTGYQYAGKKATPWQAATDPLQKIALAEFGVGEGGVSTVVTYDQTLSFGAGFADAAAAQWMRSWFDSDIDVEVDLTEMGFTITRGLQWAVVDDTATILVGEPARQFLRNSPKLLSLYMTISESQPATQSAAQAQQDLVKVHEIDGLLPALKTEMQTWPPAAFASAIHLAHWLPAGGPTGSPNRYLGTNGDPVAIAKGFARGLATTPSLRPGLVGGGGAIVIGATVLTSGAVAHYFAAFGSGAKDAGYLRRGVEAAATKVVDTVNNIKADPAYAGHVFYLAHPWTGKNDVPVELLDLGA